MNDAIKALEKEFVKLQVSLFLMVGATLLCLLLSLLLAGASSLQLFLQHYYFGFWFALGGAAMAVVTVLAAFATIEVLASLVDTRQMLIEELFIAGAPMPNLGGLPKR